MLTDLSNTLTRDKPTVKCLAKRETREQKQINTILWILPKTIILFPKASRLIKSVLCKSLLDNKKCPSPIQSPLSFQEYSVHTVGQAAPLNTSDATKLWGDECSGHLAAQRPDNCVAISEAQGYRHWPIIDTTADFLSPPAVLESGMRVHFSPFLIKVCFLVPSSWWHNSVRADIKSFL